jgi:hypothetical protein
MNGCCEAIIFGREVMVPCWFRVLNSKRDWTEMVYLSPKDRVIHYFVLLTRDHTQMRIFQSCLKYALRSLYVYVPQSVSQKSALQFSQKLFLIEET